MKRYVAKPNTPAAAQLQKISMWMWSIVPVIATAASLIAAVSAVRFSRPIFVGVQMHYGDKAYAATCLGFTLGLSVGVIWLVILMARMLMFVLIRRYLAEQSVFRVNRILVEMACRVTRHSSAKKLRLCSVSDEVLYEWHRSERQLIRQNERAISASTR